jgi:hypothetical protein
MMRLALEKPVPLVGKGLGWGAVKQALYRKQRHWPRDPPSPDLFPTRGKRSDIAHFTPDAIALP